MRALYALAWGAAAGLLIGHAARWIAATSPAQIPGVLAGLLAGALAADLVAGTVHWGCDTWGDTRTPWIGDNLIRWFRDHHEDPLGIARLDTLEVDGPNALAAAPVLALLALPPASVWLEAHPALHAGFWSLCLVGGLANHLHAWAHAPRPPRPVRALQRVGLILSRPSHARHHRLPRTEHYCIATGWLNRPFDAIGFWRGLEAVVAAVTSAEPRAGERSAARPAPQPESP